MFDMVMFMLYQIAPTRQGWHANRYGVMLLTELGDKVFSLEGRPLLQIAS